MKGLIHKIIRGVFFSLAIGCLFLLTLPVQAESNLEKHLMLSQDAGIDDLLFKPADTKAFSGSSFNGETYLCDEDGWAIGEPVHVFTSDQLICLKASYTSDNPEDVRSYIAEWKDGLGNTQLLLGQNMVPDMDMHWAFSYSDPAAITPNLGMITVKDSATCEVVATFPIEINNETPEALFEGAAYKCDQENFPIGASTTLFDKKESFCISGVAILPYGLNSIDVSFVWEDEYNAIATVPYTNLTPDTTANVYFHYTNPAEATSNRGVVKVLDASTNRIMQIIPVNFYDSDDRNLMSGRTLRTASNVYHCNDNLYAVGDPASEFTPYDNICLNGRVISSNVAEPVNLLFDWQDGLGYVTMLAGNDYITGSEYEWYYYYYNPEEISENDGMIYIKNYDTCEILESFPVNIRIGKPEINVDAGTDL